MEGFQNASWPQMADAHVHIPVLRGAKPLSNVATAAGVVLYELLREISRRRIPVSY